MLDHLKEISEILKVISNENRLAIVCHLIDKEMSVSELHEQMRHITQPALSQHLSVLKSNKILESNKNGLTMIYSIKDKRIIKILDALKNSYCK